MLYRFATIGIIAFWMVMMALLVRLETHPDSTGIMDVPVSYVARIMFKHGQQSLLTVREQDKAIGTVTLRASTTGSNARVLDFSGSLSMQLAIAGAQRFNFHGIMDMDGALRMLDFQVDLNMQQPHYQVTVKGDVGRKTLSCEVHDGTHLITAQMLPMDASALGPALLQSMGLPANAMPISTGGIAPPSVTARETQIKLHGEQVQVYEVMVTEGAAPVAEFYVTQLGQVVLARTNLGYTGSMEDYD
jgi:hypothetical protein